MLPLAFPELGTAGQLFELVLVEDPTTHDIDHHRRTLKQQPRTLPGFHRTVTRMRALPIRRQDHSRAVIL